MPLNEDFYKTILDNLSDGVYFVDTQRVITYWNQASERITGFSRQQVLGKSCQDNVLNHCTENGVELCKNGCPLTATLKNGQPQTAEVYLHHADGHRVPVRVRVAPIRDETGQIVGAVESFSSNLDLFKARNKIRSLEQTVTIDPLTKVGNRLYGEVRLKTALIEFREAQQLFGLLFVDLDNFKHINDTFGHEAGDRVLQMVASTLRQNLRQTDTVIRWGGEEFLVLVEASHLSGLREVSEKLRNLVENSHLACNGTEVGVTASIGATLVRAADSLETLVARADQLMYQSKLAGKNRVTME
jgi:diguanylate cyclase (GGDEF)-like protein/PAS domain S-box-containing protein